MQQDYNNQNNNYPNPDKKNFISKINHFIVTHKAISILISTVLLATILGTIIYSSNRKYHVDAQTTVKNNAIFTKDTGAIIGIIKNIEDKTVENTKIYLLREKDSKLNYDQDPSSTSNEQGGFTVTNIKPDSYYILATKDNTASIIERVVEPDQETNAETIILTPYKEIEGIISTNGDPLENAQITATFSQWGNITIPNITSEKGEYIFPYAPKEGEITINIEKEGYENITKTMDIKDIDESSLDFNIKKEKTGNSTTSTNSDTSSDSSEDESSSSSSDSSTDSSSSNSSSDSSSEESNSTSYTQESATLAGYSMTVTRPDDDNSYPGILMLNGLSAESLAPSGFYVVTGTVDSTEAASAIIDAMKSQDKCTSSVGVIGFSWGGGMTMEISAKTGKVTAGVEMSGLIHPLQGIDLSAGDIPNPMLFMTGENDDVAPASDTEDMYNEHLSAGRAARLYIVPGAGHGYSGSDVYSQVISFFQSYL